MLLGIQITPALLATGGLLVFGTLLFSTLVGARKIRFRGPLQLKVHRRSGYVLVTIAILHALTGLAYLGVI